MSTRATAFIGEDGTVLRTWPEAPIDAKGHVEAVYGEVSKLLA